MQTRLNVGPLAQEIAELIVAGRHDERLKWNTDGRVRVLIGKIFPEASAVKQTREGRRRRFREALTQILATHGWHEVTANTYKAEM